MNNLQENKLKMYGVVCSTCDQYQSVTDSLPQFTNNRMMLKECINNISAHSSRQMENRKGLTASQKEVRSILERLIVEQLFKIKACAKLTGNVQLMSDCSISPSRISTMSAIRLRDFASLMHSRAQENMNDLRSFQVSEQSQQDLQAAIDRFWESLNNTHMNRNMSTQNTRLLHSCFKEADKILIAMDTVVEIVRNSQSDFYSAYKQARHVVDLGSSKLDLRGQVIDSLTGEPIKGVTITFSEVSPNSRTKANRVLVKKSANKGGFYIRNMANGTYNVSAQKEGYTEQVSSVVITDGTKNELNIKLSSN